MTELAERLNLAIRLVREAGNLALSYYQTQNLDLHFKPDRSPVTRADKDAEQLIRRILDNECPQDSIIGEELPNKQGSSQYQWILDPIDGTESFIRGVPLFGVMAALQHNTQPVAGAICFPALREIIYAAKQHGAWWANAIGKPHEPLQPRPARVSSVPNLSQAALLATGFHHFATIGKAHALPKLLASVATARGWSDCYGHYLVATGRADIMIDPLMNIWDNAPLLPIIEEAGGRFSGLDGRRSILAPNALSTNGLLHNAVLAALH